MKNVKFALKGKILTIEVDLSKTFGDSKSGKSTLIATTAGNAAVPGAGDVKVGLNVYQAK